MSGKITFQVFCKQTGKSRLQVSGQITLQVLCQQTDREKQVTGVRADNVTGKVFQQTDREEQITGVRADNVTGIVSANR